MCNHAAMRCPWTDGTAFGVGVCRRRDLTLFVTYRQILTYWGCGYSDMRVIRFPIFLGAAASRRKRSDGQSTATGCAATLRGHGDKPAPATWVGMFIGMWRASHINTQTSPTGLVPEAAPRPNYLRCQSLAVRRLRASCERCVEIHPR